MHFAPADSSDLPAVADLVNSAYRGETSRQGWTTEADYLGGQRTDAQTLARDLAANAQAALMTLRDEPGGPLLGCVWLEPSDGGAWYLGMLTVRPDLQDRRLGRTLLAAAEDHARAQGARRVRMTVIQIRDTLIAWYERRGYARTGETRPFPYADLRFGQPVRDDLEFIVMERAL
ncbi:GNAT family N-acetyltransferase [Phenylobacterium sp.]|uniref:GNAT family N-acetyltransferase n=1 Tax=Phenylobacterium sp. TaxID=1871053 RepID=UPI0028A148C7|nr:GNAT family N-acetyltransferase [Phenylobacterium sp.]